MTRAISAVLAAALVACAPSSQQADTMSLATIDTVKPVDTSAAASGGTTAATQPVVGTKSSGATMQTKTGTKTAPRDTTNIGRDSAIQPNLKDPRFRLPVVDTTKRPPD